MTDQPEHQPHEQTPPAEPGSTDPSASEPTAPIVTEPAEAAPRTRPSPWERVRPRGRLGQVAAILVSVAAGLVIVGLIFFAGFAVGSDGGDGHHRGGGHSHDEGKHHRGGEEADGPGGDGSGHGDSGRDGSHDADDDSR